MFEDIETRGTDDLMALMKAYQADQREQKVDLVIGVYKDARGNVPIMKAVKMAEEITLRKEVTKTYVGISGDPEFRALVPGILLGEASPAIADGRVTSLQTPGGSGAIKVACDFLNRLEPGKRLWVSTPTWANHIPVAQNAALRVAEYPYFRPADRGLDFDAMMSHLRRLASAGDAILLHACCHNPTGVDLSVDQWKIVTDFVIERGLMPFVDCAYQGLGAGMKEDVAGLRHMASRVPEMLIASSFSKNFGIYRERTGALTVVARNPQNLAQTHGAIEAVVRTIYSMPPSHGARIVATILNDPELTRIWESELSEIRHRIADLRLGLRNRLKERQLKTDTSFLTNQRGMFSYTGFTPPMVKHLREEFGIYAANDGRINVAGLQDSKLEQVAEAFAQTLRLAETL